MSGNVPNNFQLMEIAFREDGLCDILRFLQDKTGNPVIICDVLGRIYANSTKANQAFDFQNTMLHIPPKPDKNSFIYDNIEHRLYYFAGNNNIEAVVVLLLLPEEKVENVVPFLEMTSMPLRIFFNRQKAVEGTEMHLRNQLIEDLLVNNIVNIKDLIKKSGSNLDTDRKYFIVLFQLDHSDDFENLYLFSKEWLRLQGLDIIVSTWMKSMQVYICPTHYRESTLEENYLWEKTYAAISKQKKEIKERFGVELSSGAGQIYPLEELHKSYKEAQIALTLSKLLGYEYDNKHFLDFGPFSLLYMLDSAILKKYCYDTLVTLLEHDLENDSQLIESLRILYKNKMNLKKTADSLFIHVNTIRYRINKIEELLNVDFSNTIVQVNLFIALILYDSLEATGYM